jgi:hypothetical protein
VTQTFGFALSWVSEFWELVAVLDLDDLDSVTLLFRLRGGLLATHGSWLGHVAVAKATYLES